jgi:hypothetical protein
MHRGPAELATAVATAVHPARRALRAAQGGDRLLDLSRGIRAICDWGLTQGIHACHHTFVVLLHIKKDTA